MAPPGSLPHWQTNVTAASQARMDWSGSGRWTGCHRARGRMLRREHCACGAFTRSSAASRSNNRVLPYFQCGRGRIIVTLRTPGRQFIACGIPLTPNSGDPLQLGTSIGREYAIAAALGFSSDDLLEITRNAVRAAVTSESRRAVLLSEIDGGLPTRRPPRSATSASFQARSDGGRTRWISMG